MNFPQTITDEYGRMFCKAHNLATCPICCVCFQAINDEIDATPSDRDVGIFIPEADLLKWFDTIKAKIPYAFEPDDTLFGEDAGQHSYGTKLRTFFDEDPQHPMECYVLGSKWISEDAMFADRREPVYVVLLNGELSQINLVSAHEGDEGDWIVDTKRMKKGNESVIINERLDMLARLNSSHHADKCGGDNDNSVLDGRSGKLVGDSGLLSVEEQNIRIRRGLKALSVPESVCKWDNGMHGEFLEEFLMYSFTPFEYETILQYPHGGCGSVTLEDQVMTFPSSSSANEEWHGNYNFYARLSIAKMAIHFLKDNLGGVILANRRGTKYQAIEFYNICSTQGVPCISIQYGIDPEGIKNATEFLRGETIKVIEVDNAVAVILEDHILNCTKNSGLNDIGSGLLFYEGYLGPLELLPLYTDKHSDQNSLSATIPLINFGVELEMSCASGNRTERMASSLAEHAGIDVKLRQHQGKGKDGHWPYDFGNDKSSDGDSDADDSFSSHSSMPDLDPPQTPSGDFDVNETIVVFETQDGLRDVHEKVGKAASKYTKWSICYDKSIVPNEENPLSTMLELVSPILTGGDGLDHLAHTLEVMSDILCVRLNKSMGLHVHIETKESEYPLASMISICQQFIYYEEVIDRFLNQPRRSGSEQSHSYFQSNRISIMSKYQTFNGALEALAACKSKQELYDVMNPGFRARYHKLNLQNLKSGRQPTIEFRQHHASKDTSEVRAWVSFCILFTTNCARMPPISSKDLPIVAATFDQLFSVIIRCPVLRNYYSTKN